MSERQCDHMRTIRIIMAVLLSSGLTMSPVAVGLAKAQMADCDHEQMMVETQAIAKTQAAAADQAATAAQDDCSCCKGMAKCPPAFCAVNCAGLQAVMATDTGVPNLLLQKLSAESSTVLPRPTLSPEPPPPRA